jgi:hypothetical protein
MAEGGERELLRALEIGSVGEASATVGRLLAVTGATMSRRAQLESALRTRIAIEQAKGILAERHGLELDEAFEVLRGAAREHRMKLHDLVRLVHPGEPDPPQIAGRLDRR